MTTVDLYNLFLGDERPPPRFAKFTVGPFTIELIPEYGSAVQRIGAHGSKTVLSEHHEQERADDPLIRVATTTFSERRQGGWEITAIATFDEASNTEPSILARKPIADAGVWDLCELLTFVTGRRVTIKERLERYDPNEYGFNACISIEALVAAALAWEHRHTIVNRRLTYALLLHNEALTQRMLQISAGLNNTVLNVLIDRWDTQSIAVSKTAKRELKRLVTSAVDACTELTSEQKTAFTGLLGGKIEQGAGSMTERTKALLLDLGVAGPLVTADVERRIKFLNTVRNGLTHSGEPPELKGLNEEVAMRYTTAIVTGVVPHINIMALGKALGFKTTSAGSLSQHPDHLRAFFNDGRWQDWPIELSDFEDWFYADLNEISESLL